MPVENYVKEQSSTAITIDYENTYIYIEDLSKFDEYSSLTSITTDEYLLDNNDDDLIHSVYEQNQTIRSSIDNLSLNSSITLSIPLFDQQITKQEQIKTNTDDDDDDEEDVYDIVIDQDKIMLQNQDFHEDNSHDLDDLRFVMIN